MKFILSRKGFDSEYGKIASPILPGGKLLSLPIPSKIDKLKFSDLKFNIDSNYEQLIHSLSENRSKQSIKENFTCHLDPDIYPEILPRKHGWLPIFGQIGAAQSHLKRNNIKKNDIFLFFGWFRHTTSINNRIKFDKGKKEDLHIIFGYFQIGKILENVKDDFEEWMAYHPHVASKERIDDKTNCLYIARPTLSFNKNLPGASPIFSLRDNLILTKRNKDNSFMSRSKWYLSENTFGKKIKITYHSNKNYTNDFFQSAKRGQEFILEECEEVEEWGKKVIEGL